MTSVPMPELQGNGAGTVDTVIHLCSLSDANFKHWFVYPLYHPDSKY